MKLRPYLIAAALLPIVAACSPGAAEYTENEAPHNLVLDNASSHVGVRFAPGSSQLSPGAAAQLRALAASGRIAPSDHVTIAASGGPGLAASRVAHIADLLLPYRIIVSAAPAGGVPANYAIVQTARYLVTLPGCPNWSRVSSDAFSNTVNSNFGCATAVNLGESVASPAELAEGRPVGLADAVPAAAAVQRYEADKVISPSALSIGTIATPSSSGSGAGATGAGTAGTGP